MVATPVRESLLTENVFQGCVIKVSSSEMVADLIPPYIHDFVAILGMDWLANYHAIVDYFRNEVIFKKHGESDIIFCRERRVLPSCVISTMTAKQLLRK